MFALLYQYLIDRGEVYVQGIGNLQMIAQPAAYDVANQQLLAPRHSILIKNDVQHAALQHQMAFISRQLNITEEEAFEQYQQYCEQLKNEIDKHRKIPFNGIGSLEKLQDGSYSFINSTELDIYRQPVAAVRVIRKNTAHHMMVGAKETTSTEMRELLEEQPVTEKKSRWWLAAVIIGAVAIVLICLKRFAYL